MRRLLFILLCGIALSACSNDGRMVEKFLSRLNAQEYNAASVYVYPNDYAKLYTFKQICEKSPNLLFHLSEKNNIEINGSDAVRIELACENMTPYFKNYMKDLGLLYEEYKIIDTLYIRNTRNGKKITFNWADMQGENLKLAYIRDSSVRTMNIRAQCSISAPVIGHLLQEERIIIDDYSENEFVKCFIADERGRTTNGYILRHSLETDELTFFPLGIFDSMSILVALVVLVIIAFIFASLSDIFAAIASIPVAGIIIDVALILGLLYSAYQLIEKILFELFIINLPF